MGRIFDEHILGDTPIGFEVLHDLDRDVLLRGPPGLRGTLKVSLRRDKGRRHYGARKPC
jgi:hypothetical protein